MAFWKKFASLALCSAMALGLAACSGGKDTVVATVNGTEIYRWEVDNLLEQNREAYEGTSGVDLDDPANKETLQAYREYLLNLLVQDTAVNIRAREMGYDLTDEEKAEVDAEYDAMVQKNIEYYMENDFKGQEDAEQKAREEYEKSLAEHNLTEEILRQNMYDQKMRLKLSDTLYAEVAAGDDAVQQAYEERVAEDKAKYENDLEAYETANAADSISVFYHPENYKRFKHILIPMPQETTDKLDELYAERAKLVTEASALSLTKGEEDNAVISLRVQIRDLDETIASVKAEGLASIQAKAEEVLKKVQEGEDFDALIDEFGGDEQMQAYPYKQYGYLICQKSTGYDQDVKAAVMGLQKEGDVSSLVGSVYGYHIIKIIDTIEKGPRPFEEVQDILTQLIELTPKQQIFEEFAAEAAQQCEIKTYPDRL